LILSATKLQTNTIQHLTGSAEQLLGLQRDAIAENRGICNKNARIIWILNKKKWDWRKSFVSKMLNLTRRNQQNKGSPTSMLI
jgi:hypothetical protein